MATSPTYIGVDASAVKEATKNNYKAATSSSFDDKLYSATSDLSYYMGPAISAGVESAQGSGSTSAMAVDVAINATTTGDSGLSTSLGSGLAAYSTGGGTSSSSSSLSTALGGTAGYTFDPYASSSTTSSSSSDLDTQEFASNMTSSNTEFLTMQMFVQNESSKFTMLSSILKSQHDSQMTAARNAA